MVKRFRSFFYYFLGRNQENRVLLPDKPASAGL